MISVIEYYFECYFLRMFENQLHFYPLFEHLYSTVTMLFPIFLKSIRLERDGYLSIRRNFFTRTYNSVMCRKHSFLKINYENEKYIRIFIFLITNIF